VVDQKSFNIIRAESPMSQSGMDGISLKIGK
jgi:hypothetical protein